MQMTILKCIRAAGAVAVLGWPLSAAPVQLANLGEPTAAIVVPGGFTGQMDSVERQAAGLLRRYIERISGAELAIIGAEDVQKHTGNLIIIGDSGLAARYGVDASSLGPGGIRLKTVRNAVVLLGGPARRVDRAGLPGYDNHGVLYAAIELLEQLGCRYLWPGESGMVVPRRERLVVAPLDITYTPQIQSRYFRAANKPRITGFDRTEAGLERLGMSVEQWEEGYARSMGNAPQIGWGDWQRLGGSMPRFGHAGAGLRNGQKYMDSNPEWFAMQADGTRWQAGSTRWRLCKSNEQLIEHVANDIIRQRDQDPTLTLVSLDPNDGSGETGWCQCEKCKALDPPNAPVVSMLIFPTSENRSRNRRQIDHPSLTDRMLYYWNSIAERVTQVHPDLLFGVSAYSRFRAPPVERTVHPNLILRYVSSDREGWRGWQEAGARWILWRPNILLEGREHGRLVSYVGTLAESMHYFADRGLIQTDIDANTHYWAVHGLSYYAAARLNWNPSLTSAAIISDFARHGFGAGAPYIEKYFQRLEELYKIGREGLTDVGVDETAHIEWERHYPPRVLAELRSLLNAAARAAGAEPEISARIAFLRLGLNFTELQDTLNSMSRRVETGGAVDRVLARRLVDLNCLVLRDIMLQHNQAIHVPLLVQVSGTFSKFRPIGGATVTPSDETLLQRIGDPRYGLTGREDSLDEMLEAFGL